MPTNHTTSTGEFPNILIEEELIHQEIPKAVHQEIQEAFQKGLPALKEHALDCLHKFSQRSYETKIARSKLYLLILGCIQKKLSKGKEPSLELEFLSYLGKRNLTKQLHNRHLFPLAVQAIRCDFTEAFKKVMLAAKRTSLPEDLTFYKDSAREETLAHMATKLDRRDIIQYLISLNRETLEMVDKNGETIAHICATSHATNTAEFLLNTSKKAFGRKNYKGQIPLELEGGEFLCRMIATKSVAEELHKAKTTSLKARQICEAASKRPPKTLPLPSLPI
jgi:hypothetical protein